MRTKTLKKHGIAVVTIVMMLFTLLCPAAEIAGSVAFADESGQTRVEDQGGAGGSDSGGQNGGDQNGNGGQNTGGQGGSGNDTDDQNTGDQGGTGDQGNTGGQGGSGNGTDDQNIGGQGGTGDQGNTGNTGDGGVTDPADPGTGDDPTDQPQQQPKNGWVTENGSKYYYENDVAKTGLQTIDGNKYYFNSSGVMQTGLKKLSGKLYYFGSSGKATKIKGWTTAIKGGKRYGNGDGTIAIGKKKIGKNWYYFGTATGKLAVKGFFTYQGSRYYCVGSGKLATGWKAIGNYGYYFYPKSAKMAKNTKIGYLKIPKSGKLGKAYAQGIRTLNKKGWTLRAAYNFSSTKIRYAHKGMRKKSSEAYAVYGFSNKKGNCFVMAGTFYVMAKLLGYDVHQVKGHVGYWCPHSWTTIRHGKKKYVYDPQFRNRTGRSGFKIYYGKKGTWRYNRMKNMN